MLKLNLFIAKNAVSFHKLIIVKHRTILLTDKNHVHNLTSDFKI